MGTQTSLKFSINNGFRSSEKTICLSNYSNKENLISFNEYDSVSLLSEFENESDFLIIETTMEEVRLDSTNKYIDLSNYNNGDMYVPGTYQIKYYRAESLYDYNFSVLPHTITSNELDNIKTIIEHYHSGLVKNQMLKQMISNGEKYNFSSSIYSTISYVKDNQNQLFELVRSIIKDPISCLDKEHRYTCILTKPDSKTIRKLSQGGASSNCKKTYYEKHTILNHDIIENKWLFYTLKEIVSLLIDLKVKLSEYQSLLENDLHQELLRNKDFSERYNKIKNSFTISDNYKTKLHSMQKYSSILVQEKKQQLDKISSLHIEIIPTLEYINYIFDEDFFRSISLEHDKVRVTAKIVKDYRYSWINNYLDYLRGNINSNDIIKPNYRDKATSLLYEYYSVIFIVKILENMGFYWISGWVKDESEIYNDLSSGTRLTFIRENETIYIDYDREISYENQGVSSDFLAINSFNRKPDILLSYFINEDIKGAVIFEVKYRKSHNIYNHMGDTKVVEQMKNYLQIAYYDQKKERPELGIVKKVVVLYPNQEHLINYKDRVYSTVFDFIPLCPNNHCEVDNGYNRVSEIIMSLIEESYI